MRETRRVAVAAIAAAALFAAGPSRATVQTYSAASGEGGVGIDHPGGGFFQFDPGGWDTGLDAATPHPPAGEFAFSGSDGAFHMEVHTLLDQGVTGRTGDNVAYFQMNYNPSPPDTLFGSFWFGGVGNDIGPFPHSAGSPVPFDQVLVWADVVAPAGAPMEFRTESDFGPSGNGRKFAFTGTGTWQTVGGAISDATGFGNFNLEDSQLASLIAFGQNGNEITAVDDGSDPLNVPAVMVDNLCLTIARAAWNVDGAGSWSANANWDISAPDGPNATAVFGNKITAPSTVTVDSQQFAGTIQFDSAQPYTLDGSGTVSLRTIGAGGANVASSIDVVQGNHSISAPLEIWGGVAVNVEQAGSTLTVSNLQPTFLPGAGVSKQGSGTLAVNNVRASDLSVHSGKVQILSNGSANSPAGTSVVQSLTIDSGATLDLTNNSMVIDYTGPVGTLVDDTRTMLKNNQLASSSADSSHRIGYLDNATRGLATFSGQSVDSSSILIKFTYGGDANLDGQVDVTDLGALATNWQTSNVWAGGDFNYDGFVDVTDLGILATDWQLGVGSPLGAGSLQAALQSVGLGNVAVPEPASIAAIGLCFAAASRRRRRSIARGR